MDDQGSRVLSHADEAIDIYVIGNQGSFRASSLGETLEMSPFPVTVIDPVYVRPDALSDLTDEVAARRVFGRALTRGEVGCWFAHRMVYETIRSRGATWNVVLEDDAVVPREFWTDLRTWLTSLGSHRPIIVSLFAQDHPRGRPVSMGPGITLLALPYGPTNTLAYVINRKAVEIALTSPPRAMSTADWPPWSTDVGFFLLAGTPILHEGASTIGFRPDPSSRSRPFVRLLTVLTPQTWRAARPYCRGVRGYIDWAFLTPARKAVRRALTRPIASHLD